ncbi:helix-turn-helix domain-containing protein [Niabella ginsengisoli]|uniref:Helix-turn-helix domain-containing protein n=1 Tax=Niabella ginsengisoli TaxID=522298 RepID=A0ABS9SMF1_9BACT|nr:helix-turn-helix domain-containing protein [Niabella ginsengisoli]MCH5599515.1 helix-turn-helix domain-containing protein [Niabella ginsengisoli]
MSRIIIELEKEELRLLVEEAVQSVIEKNTTKEKPVDMPEILNVEQVCRLLNMKRSTLYQKTHKSEIPFSKKGKALYFNRSEIYQWLSEGRHLTEEEQMEAADLMLLQANKRRLNRMKNSPI